MVRRAFAFDFNVVNTTDKILNALRAEFDELFVCEWAFFVNDSGNFHYNLQADANYIHRRKH